MQAGATIRAFVRRFDLRVRAASVATSAVALAVVLLAVVWIVELAIPRWALGAIRGAILAWTALVVWHWLRSGSSIHAVDRALGCRDGLRTWVGGVPAGPMRDWLARDLEQRLAQSGRGASWRPVRRRLRPLRVLLPILAALLVLRWLAPDGDADRMGTAGGGAQGGPGAGDAGGGGDGQDTNAEQPADTESETPEQPPPPIDPPDDLPDDPTPDPPAPQQPPKDLIADRPNTDEFVVPDFVGSGPSRVGQAHVAEVGQGGDDKASRSTAARRVDVDPQRDVEFERARELALRSRHVRDDERPLVRRYFERFAERSR